MLKSKSDDRDFNSETAATVTGLWSSCANGVETCSRFGYSLTSSAVTDLEDSLQEGIPCGLHRSVLNVIRD